MRYPTAFSKPAAVVLGCGDVGSAVALALHVAGLAVVLIDEADPAWHRRGMAFTNAWYVGNAELDGEGACFCGSLKSIPSVLSRRLIAATTWSWPGVASLLAPRVLVDSRRRKRRGSEILLGRVPLTIGIGVAFVEGENVDVAIESADGSAEGLRAAPSPRSAAAVAELGACREADCIGVEAARHGRFMTERRIGDAVRVGQVVGGLGNEVVVAPAAGVLLGLAARGARIEPGDTLVEVDPAGAAYRCHGIGEGQRRVAASALAALSRRGMLPGAPPSGPGSNLPREARPLSASVEPRIAVTSVAPS
jgi:xanthine dehydrogenase accessory factor